MKKFLISAYIISRVILIVVLVFLPLLIIRGELVVLNRLAIRKPKDTPQWASHVTDKLQKFYDTYLQL